MSDVENFIQSVILDAGSIMFHVRRRPSDAQPRRRKKKSGAGTGSARPGNEPMLVEVAPDGSALENGRRVRILDLVEVSWNSLALKLSSSPTGEHLEFGLTSGWSFRYRFSTKCVVCVL